MNYTKIKKYRDKNIIDCVLDTDTFNEIDDQFAICYLLQNRDKINIKGIYAAPFVNGILSDSPDEGMEKSFNEIHKLLDYTNNKELKSIVYKGSRKFLPSESEPVISEAALNLVNITRNYSKEKPLFVIAIGAITNIASAILIDPSIKDKVVLVWLGGTGYHIGSTVEFNMIQDIPAARVIFEKFDNIIMLPCEGVVSEFSTTYQEVSHFIKGKNKACDYLCEILKNVTNEKKPTSRVIWDVTAVAWLLNKDELYMVDKIVKLRMPGYNQKYEAESDKEICQVVKIKRDELYNDLFNKLVKL